MLSQILAATGVLTLLTIVPGPDMAIVTRRALVSGRGDGFRTAGGITAGLAVWGLLTVAGLAAVLEASATAYTVVKIAGAVYLLFLGVQALLQSRRGKEVTQPAALPRPAGNPWRAGLLCDLLNPKIAVFYTGLLPSLAPRDLPVWAGLTLLVAVHVLITLAWLCGYVYLISRARPFFESPRVRRVLNRVTGIVFIAFGVRLATE